MHVCTHTHTHTHTYIHIHFLEEKGAYSLLMTVKEESEKAGLKFSIQTMKIMASDPISSVQFKSVAQSCPTLSYQKPMPVIVRGISSIELS